MAKNTICLWYDKDAEAAARFYAETFPDSAVGAIHRSLSRPQRRSRVQA
jgi:predicted 3-demethylubiquinone-9 3-methyltransferase (glyoxalase superfamily)